MLTVLAVLVASGFYCHEMEMMMICVYFYCEYVNEHKSIALALLKHCCSVCHNLQQVNKRALLLALSISF